MWPRYEIPADYKIRLFDERLSNLFEIFIDTTIRRYRLTALVCPSDYGIKEFRFLRSSHLWESFLALME
jgi:hypothetical protein